MVDTNTRSTLNSDADIPRQPGSGPSHADKTRPADAGHVWGTDAMNDERSGGVPGGVLMTQTTRDGEVKPLSQSAIKEQTDSILHNSTDETVSNEGEPSDQAKLTEEQRRNDMMATAIATNADNTPGPRPSQAVKNQAKKATNPASPTGDDAKLK